MMGRFRVQWIDGGREAQAPSDPRYPNGIDLDTAGRMAARRCRVRLPYPAKRCGQYLIECQTCGLFSVVTAAGRRDDPRSVTVGCRNGVVRK